MARPHKNMMLTCHSIKHRIPLWTNGSHMTLQSNCPRLRIYSVAWPHYSKGGYGKIFVSLFRYIQMWTRSVYHTFGQTHNNIIFQSRTFCHRFVESWSKKLVQSGRLNTRNISSILLIKILYYFTVNQKFACIFIYTQLMLLKHRICVFRYQERNHTPLLYEIVTFFILYLMIQKTGISKNHIY